MKLIKIDRPYQRKKVFSEEQLQLIEGRYPEWSVRTEMITEKDGGYLKWINDKEIFVDSHPNIEGIYLYDIKALYQGIVGHGRDIIYYIRFAYIKSK